MPGLVRDSCVGFKRTAPVLPLFPRPRPAASTSTPRFAAQAARLTALTSRFSASTPRFTARANATASRQGACSAASATATARSAARPFTTAPTAPPTRARDARRSGARQVLGVRGASGETTTSNGFSGGRNASGYRANAAIISGGMNCPSRTAAAHSSIRLTSVRFARNAFRFAAERCPCVVCAAVRAAFPSGVRGPVLRPPCIRHRPFAIAGARHAHPLRVRAPQRGARLSPGLPSGLPPRRRTAVVAPDSCLGLMVVLISKLQFRARRRGHGSRVRGRSQHRKQGFPPQRHRDTEQRAPEPLRPAVPPRAPRKAHHRLSRCLCGEPFPDLLPAADAGRQPSGPGTAAQDLPTQYVLASCMADSCRGLMVTITSPPGVAPVTGIAGGGWRWHKAPPAPYPTWLHHLARQQADRRCARAGQTAARD